MLGLHIVFTEPGKSSRRQIVALSSGQSFLALAELALCFRMTAVVRLFGSARGRWKAARQISRAPVLLVQRVIREPASVGLIFGQRGKIDQPETLIGCA